ncbi:LOW QUALITY PROTEIN: high affinity immunoglobulin epsilon receptor subunit beta [Rhynchocyon petersi]
MSLSSIQPIGRDKRSKVRDRAKDSEIPKHTRTPMQHCIIGASGIELSEIALHDDPLLQKAATPVPQRTWLTVLKKELEFLGVTQILIGLICFSFGTIIYSTLDISASERELFSSFTVGYPFWGAIFFSISGVLSVMCEKKYETYLVQGRLGANSISSIASGAGIIILIINLKKSSSYLYNCPDVEEEALCFVVFFSTEIVAILLFLTILGFCSAVSLMIYGVGELLRKDKVPEDRLYEELNISPIYSELEDREETSPSTDP